MDKLNVIEGSNEDVKREQQAYYCGIIGTAYLLAQHDRETRPLMEALVHACARCGIDAADTLESAIRQFGFIGGEVADAEIKIRAVRAMDLRF